MEGAAPHYLIELSRPGTLDEAVVKVEVRPGDLVLGDIDGVVVVPRPLVEAVLVAAAFFLAVWRPLVRAQGSSSPDVRDVVHALAKVRVSIPAKGVGEIVFSAGGSLPAGNAARISSWTSVR